MRAGQWLTRLGLDEYMQWCEDMNMKAFLAVWAGKSFGDILSGSDLHPYVDDIMNELEVRLQITSLQAPSS